MGNKRKLPDSDLNLRDARDFIITSSLARKALMTKKLAAFPNFLNDFIEKIYRLCQSCHMPEFTDHGLPHICSLVERISAWTNDKKQYIVDTIRPEEAAELLLAVLIHDLGMLSQNAEDLPIDSPPYKQKGNNPSISEWVRKTHVDRLPFLFERITDDLRYKKYKNLNIIKSSICIAQSHQSWPWDWNQLNRTQKGLAAILAVADLLDEDSARCDTMTLIKHREGNEHNISHWIRHCLTFGRIYIAEAIIVINMVKPPKCNSNVLEPFYAALRNHFRLIFLYSEELSFVGAKILNVNFEPEKSIPKDVSDALDGWNGISGFNNEHALCFHLLETLNEYALDDTKRIKKMEKDFLSKIPFETVSLDFYNSVRGNELPLSSYEKTFKAIKGA